VACVVRGDDAATLLLDAVGRASAPLVSALAGRRGRRAVVAAMFAPPAAVHPALVSATVDLLLDNGFAEVVVGSAVRTADRDRGYEDVAGLAAAAGCTGRTPCVE